MFHLFTHNDLDGVGCGILAKLAFGKEVNVQYLSISRLNHQVEVFLEEGNVNENLMITDLSVNEDNEKRISAFVAAGGEVSLIDHHKSADHLNKHNWASVTVEQEDGKLTSATSLFYEYLIQQGFLEQSKSKSEFVELVRQYDTWEWDINKNFTAKRLNDLLFMITIEEFEEKMISKLAADEPFRFDNIEKKLIQVEEKRVARYINRKKREVYQISIGDYLAGVVHAESNHSELGNELSKEFSHLDYIAMIMVGGKRISLRTNREDVDVSEVASEFDGGGHRKASGCNLTEQAFKQFVEQTFFAEPLKRDAWDNRHNLKESTRGTLYKGKNDETIFIYQKDRKDWVVEVNQKLHSSKFPTYRDAERFIKLTHAAWLVRDEEFVGFLLKNYQKKH
jgi:uncharacterized protein